jgi:hypothetical protein
MKNFMPIGRSIIVIFVTVLLPFGALAQNKGVVSLNWTNPISLIDSSGYQKTVPFFSGANCGYAYLPEYTFTTSGYVVGVDIVEDSVVSASAADVSLLRNFRNSDFNISLHYGYQSGRIVSIVRILPIRLNSFGSLEKLKTFSYQLRFGQAPPQPVKQSQNNSRGLSNQRITANSSSVLASGDWYKFSISSTGIYKIDYETLVKAGINPDNINPQQLRLFGNGGGMLPVANSAARIDDLAENAIFVSGEADGRFDKDDYILFYAVGPHTWQQNGNVFNHIFNIYSDLSYYFLSTNSGYGLRVSDRSLPATYDMEISVADEYDFHEKDEVNILNSGQEWFGELFSYATSNRSFVLKAENAEPNTNAVLKVSVMAAANVNTSFNVSVNNQQISTLPVNGIGNLFTDTYSLKGNIETSSLTISSNILANGKATIGLAYNYNGNASYKGYLNYIELNYKRRLVYTGTEFGFRAINSTSVNRAKYIVSNPVGGMRIWNISNPVQPENIPYGYDNGNAVFNDHSNTLQEYRVFAGSNFPRPGFVSKIPNQNLHSIGTPVPELLIITPGFLRSSAERLAQHRRAHSGMRVNVVDVNEIYNEFSSGAQDLVAIRDFIRMVYERSTASDSLKYVLLFGDCSYDYKDRIKNNSNLIPVYQARKSLHPTETYSSDDFYGFMDINEGDWQELGSSSIPIEHSLALGIGRLPVNTMTEADILVSKIIYYDSSPQTLDNWRNRICFIADDGDRNAYQNSAERFALRVNQDYPLLNISKVYLDAFQQISAPGGEVSLDAKNQLTNEVEKGLLVANYIGHGGVGGWTQEEILEISDINSWKNKDKLTFMVTATCDFGRYDDPSLSSGAEYAIRSAQGGAIALMTTTRPVYATSNDIAVAALYNFLFTKINGQWPDLGYVMKHTKNKSISGVFNRNYSLLGDPSQKLAYPKEQLIVTSINGNDPLSYTDTLGALSRVTIEGEVRTGGVLNADFSGTLSTIVYDKNTQLRTLGNESDSPPMDFVKHNNALYNGKATVNEGKFKFSFVVPKDISYIKGPGKISLYAAKTNTILDAGGYEKNLIIGGASDNVAEDNTPPSLKLFMNDESFVNGGLTGSNSTLLVNLFDESGINIAGTGIGHELTAVLDDSKEVIILNEYYTAKLDSYQEGVIKYPLRNLAPGNHSIRVKVWDTHNNSSEGILEFVVANDEDLSLRNVFNYPNPFSTNTEFHFDHNRAGEDLDVLIQIYTISGKLIKSIRETKMQSSSHVASIYWNGRDDFGDKIGKGVYVYKLQIRAARDGSNTYKYQKLVILN